MGEIVLRRAFGDAGLGDVVHVDSAGTGGWHVGGPADPRAAAVLRARGYDDAHVARQFAAEWFAGKDLVLALDAGHVRALRALAPTPDAAEKVRLLRSFDPGAGEDLDVADPYYGDDAGFELTLDQVEAAAPGILEHVRAWLAARSVG
ncbi:low molecular weight protein-tyrosine-phosphatase [Motilibacter aurantiacus]|uniref:low molecular weight protein-tyrosine-phosphatase n=1 Tax=Motilibacter aurantiacus TaxID=2714955 RepID=UPI0018C8769F